MADDVQYISKSWDGSQVSSETKTCTNPKSLKLSKSTLTLESGRLAK